MAKDEKVSAEATVRHIRRQTLCLIPIIVVAAVQPDHLGAAQPTAGLGRGDSSVKRFRRRRVGFAGGHQRGDLPGGQVAAGGQGSPVRAT